VQTTVIAVDVDGTLFDGHTVAPAAVAALERARADGHLLAVLTGRRWDSLPDVLGPVLALFHRVVGEEGGYLADVASGVVRLLAPALDPLLVDALRDAGVPDLDVGSVVVGGPVSHLDVLTEVCHRVGGDRHVVVNKQSVALVPDGHDKRSGLLALLADFGMPDARVIAIGDAANDLPMFAAATVAVAVANADTAVRAAGIELTEQSFGDGVAEALQRHLPLRDPRRPSTGGPSPSRR
jgi:hydroxymethylpyrimidine pyrophosphatase-like HAD family hydrolase